MERTSILFILLALGLASAAPCANLSDDSTWGTMVVNDTATGTLYVNENTILCTDTYYFNAAAATAVLRMNSSNIALDCNNSILDGVDGNGYGVYITGKENNTVGNCTVRYYQYGFYAASGSNNNAFIDNTLLNNTINGVYLYNHSGSILINNSIYLHNGTSDSAVAGDSLENVTIYGNRIYDNYYGVFLTNSRSINISNNTLLRHGKESLRLDPNVNNSWVVGNFANITAGVDRDQCIQYGSSHNGLIADNRFYGCYQGIYLRAGSTNTTVSNNTVDSVSFQALIFANVRNNTAIGNTLIGNSSDIIISLYGSDEADCDNVITNNTGSGGRQIFYSNETVSLSGGDYSQIVLCGANNSVIENIYMPGDPPARKNGIKVHMSENVSARNITVNYASLGFEIYYSKGITIENAIFENSNYAGIWIFYTNGSAFRNITISSVQMQDYSAGIWLDRVNNSVFSEIRISGSNPPAIYAKNSTNNTVSNTTLFNTGKYLLHENDTVAWNIFDAFTLCKDNPSANPAGCIEFDYLNMTYANLINNTNILLANDFVLINSSDGNASQFNMSANITLEADCSPGVIYTIYMKEDFPSSAADIVANGTLYTPTRMSCANDYFTFGVTSFSGYALEEGTLNLTIYPSVDVLPHVPTNASCDSSNSGVMLELYRNDVLVANGTSHVEDASNLTAGTYNYVCNTTNYSSAYATGTLRVRAANTGGSTSPMGISIEGDEVVGNTLIITVRDGSTPVDGAEVRILYWSGGILNAINLGNTNSDGEVEFTPTFAGEYTVEATNAGYGAVEFAFSVEAAEAPQGDGNAEQETGSGLPGTGCGNGCPAGYGCINVHCVRIGGQQGTPSDEEVGTGGILPVVASPAWENAEESPADREVSSTPAQQGAAQDEGNGEPANPLLFLVPLAVAAALVFLMRRKKQRHG